MDLEPGRSKAVSVSKRVHTFIILAVMLMLISGYLFGGNSDTHAQAPLVWSTPVEISDTDRFNWFADITVDSYGIPHVIWDAGLSKAEIAANPGTEVSLLMHSHLVDGGWSVPRDVDAQINVEGHIYRGVITADLIGNIFVLYEGDLLKVSAMTAHGSAANWSEPEPVGYGAVYMGGILADEQGILHALFDELTLLDDPVRGVYGQVVFTHLSDILYRRSIDNGRTWSDPVNLSRTQVGEHREKLELDSRGVIYATWDEGWDRLTESGQPEQGVLRLSFDGGQTWGPKMTFAAPERTNAQFVAIGDGRAGIMAVWRATNRNEIFYSWSVDDGTTWSVPQPIRGLFARPWEETRFDSYDLAVDSAGTIHLAVVGRLDTDRKDSQVYHLTWNGEAWSVPNLIQAPHGWPEYPRMVVGQGNRLHLVWFVRDQLPTTGGQYQIWYSGAIAAAQELPLPPTPTPTLTPTPTAAPIALPTATVPAVSITGPEVEAINNLATILYTENDDLLLLLKSLAPVFMIVLVLIFVRRFR